MSMLMRYYILNRPVFFLFAEEQITPLFFRARQNLVIWLCTHGVNPQPALSKSKPPAFQWLLRLPAGLSPPAVGVYSSLDCARKAWTYSVV